MNLRAALPLLLLLPGVHALEVSPDSVSADDGTVLVRWEAHAPGALWLEAAGISGTLVETTARDRVVVGHPDMKALVESVTGGFETEAHPMPGGPGRLTLLQSRSATVLVQPLSADFEATLSGAPVTLRSVHEELLEQSHAHAAQGHDAEPQVSGGYYAYRVQDVVAAQSDRASDVRVRGDFLLYLWNATVLQEAPHVTDAHRTGTWHTEGTTPLHRTDHYQHALVAVRGGDLRIHAPDGGSLYAPELLLHDTPDGEGLDAVLLAPSADARTVRATQQGGRVVFTAVPAPATVPAADAASPAWLVAPLALLGAATLPNLLGLHDPGRDLRPDDRGKGPLGRLRRGRAAGYLRLALRAEGRHRFGRAAFWMGRSVRWSGDPEARMQQAIFLRMAGRPARALRRHREAREMFRMEGASHALNGYEAARAAALLGRQDEALLWLLSAVREETWLARRAPFEPDLAPLRVLPAFMDLLQAADPDGYLRP